MRPFPVRSVSCFKLLGILGFLTPALAPSVSAGPYVALVNGSEVKVRTGGSQNHFTFGTVRMGQRVVVERDVNGWSKIYIPRWIPVYVHKNYVEVSGSKGRVKAGELNIRVVPNRAHEVVGNLAAGSEVEVLGKDGDWLKIAPPPSAFAYVSQRYLVKDRDIGADEVGRQLAVLTSASDPAAVTSATSTPTKQGGTAKAAGGSSKGAGAAVPGSSSGGSGGNTSSRGALSARTLPPPATAGSLRRADELAMKISAEEDVLRRDYGPAKTIYQDVLKSSEDQAEIRAAEAGLRKIDQIEGNQATLAAAHRSVAEVEKKNQEIDQRVRNARFSRPSRAADSDPYLARGWLSGFGLFSGHPGTHRLMKGSQVLYYLQSEEGKSISLDSYLNRRVGVKGVIRELEPKYGANLIVVSEITVLSDR